MSNQIQTALHVRDNCLCFATQRAARLLARHFDAAFRPIGITNNQFSLMAMLSAIGAPPITRLGPALGMDRTSVTAAIRALERAGLVTVAGDPEDRRSRRPSLTARGLEVLRAALPIWKREHEAYVAARPGLDADMLRQQLANVSSPPIQQTGS